MSYFCFLEKCVRLMLFLLPNGFVKTTSKCQSWMFIGRIDAEAETAKLWPFDVKSWLLWKDPDAGKDWGQEEKAMTEDEMVGWHHRLDGHGFGWTPGIGDGQGGLASCGSWGRKESDTTERLNWTFMYQILRIEKWSMISALKGWPIGDAGKQRIM